MPNLTYDIVEKSVDTSPVDIDELLTQIEETDNCEIASSSIINEDELCSIELDYNTNYTVKDLNHILDYYKIQRKKLKKEEMIQIIILFECSPENQSIVYRRKQLWYYIKELKKDKYFKKYIIFNPPVSFN